ncbi:hypothetical protein [Rhodopseudomonas palustris]|uniref:hypothetical protein n=1 Tax=Rhodopseudomonas palustris TaxID=1076 RepID=UPI00131C5295|nr:hypothetical protein [Rhodopseudomonas palustris]
MVQVSGGTLTFTNERRPAKKYEQLFGEIIGSTSFLAGRRALLFLFQHHFGTIFHSTNRQAAGAARARIQPKYIWQKVPLRVRDW